MAGGLLGILSILAPILLMMAAGVVLRWKFHLDLSTLSRISIYLFVPAFVFDKVSTSDLSWGTMGAVMLLTVAQVLLLALIVIAIGRIARPPRATLAAVALAVMFYNSGNYGLPLAELAFGREGAAVQSLVLLTQNFLTFTVGLGIAAWAGSGGVLKGLGTLIRLPVIPTLVGALLAKWWLTSDPSHRLPTAISQTAHYLGNALVPVALLTLGAQLASNPRWPRWRPVGTVVILRLLVAPIAMGLMLWGLHVLTAGTGHAWLDLWPWPAQVLILTAAVPTAVNTLLLTMELEGDADLAADCVFWTTVLSVVTTCGWLAAVAMMR